jgi:hypothetical protein
LLLAARHEDNDWAMAAVDNSDIASNKLQRKDSQRRVEIDRSGHYILIDYGVATGGGAPSPSEEDR